MSLKDVLESNGIDPRRLLAASKRIEQLRNEDRAIRFAKQRAKGNKASDTEKALAEKKGRSGKAVTRPLLDRALAGESLKGPAKTRIVRALNHLLKQKGKDEVALRDIF